MLGVLSVLVLGASGTVAQPTEGSRDTTVVWHEDAWTLMVDQGGVRIHYIYYPEADAEHDGVVLRLINDNETPVRYAFTLIFRAPAAETTTTVRGRLEPGALKTGDEAGLFWVPFRGADHSLGEIGIRGLDVWPVREPRGS